MLAQKARPVGENVSNERFRPRQHQAEHHRDQDHDDVLKHDDGAPYLRPKSGHGFYV